MQKRHSVQQGHTASTKPTKPKRGGPTPPPNRNQSRPKIARHKDRPPPNLGGYGPFQPYACQAPNGWVTDELWIEQLVVHNRRKGLTRADY
jgi:hypothetical protein